MFRKLLLGFGKAMALKVVRREGDKLQARLVAEVSSHGPQSIDRLCDQFQLNLIYCVERLGFVPDSICKQIAAAIQEKGDEMQKRLHQEFDERGAGFLNDAFDRAQAALEKHINTLA